MPIRETDAPDAPTPAPTHREPTLADVPVRLWLAGLICSGMAVRVMNQPPDRIDLLGREVNRVCTLALHLADELLLRASGPS